MSLLIGNNCVVSIHYTLTDDAGTVLDSSRQGDPLKYLHGANNIIPGLENELTGKAPGASMKVTVEPEDGYGEHQPDAVQTVPRAAFEGVEDIQPGMQFQTEGPHGVQIIVVTEVSEDDVTIDANHPLAGKTLHFDVSIEEVRDATPEEIAHGHVH
ncbi:FKBP-type peptidyl-prolyl cis-trans isomerase [Kaarinaea lacus]